MREAYQDIRERIAEDPTWYDKNGAPRYGEFSTQLCPDIYANTVVLLRILRQACHQPFDVEMSSGYFAPIQNPFKLHYGDPPSHGCVGDTMNCEDIAVLQVWNKESLSKWERRADLEGLIDGSRESHIIVWGNSTNSVGVNESDD